MADLSSINQMTLPQYYRACDHGGDSLALTVYGRCVKINDDAETFAFIFYSGMLDQIVRITDQPLALDYSVHDAPLVCERCGRPVEIDNLHGKDDPRANFCLGMFSCLQKFSPAAESELEPGQLVSVTIDREAALAN